MKTYASFDVGRKHMAFVAMREDGTVLTTRVDQLSGYDLVLIERQMSINTRAMCLQHQMHTYCVCHALAVIIVSSKLKTPADLKTYAQRKKYTVARAVRDGVPFPVGYKRDDVADAYCQLVAYLKFQ
jgi:hypothetical protein